MPTFCDPSRDPITPRAFLNELSTALWDERNLLVSVTDVILTLIGCVLLKVDHRPWAEKFKDVISESQLDALKSDFENLMYFEAKDMNALVLDLMRVRASSGQGTNPREIWRSTGVDGVFRNPEKRIMGRTVLTVVSFLIFRRPRRRYKTEASEFSWILQRRAWLAVTTPPYHRRIKLSEFTGMASYFSWFRAVGRHREGCSFKDIREKKEEEEEIGQELSDSLKRELEECLNREKLWSPVEEKPGHVCYKIYCPICCGWLWMPIWYLFLFVYTVIATWTWNLFAGVGGFLPIIQK